MVKGNDSPEAKHTQIANLKLLAHIMIANRLQSPSSGSIGSNATKDGDGENQSTQTRNDCNHYHPDSSHRVSCVEKAKEKSSWCTLMVRAHVFV
jgi:hypothetical protein